MATKKRKRPTKLRVRDSDAVASLLAFGLNHRAAVADQCWKRFREVRTDADKLSLAVECFMCLMANVEDLEKAYFALRLKAAGAKGSFFELFTNTDVREPHPSQRIGKGERSARVMRRELAQMDLTAFGAALGLPGLEEWKGLGRAPTGLGPGQVRRRYSAELGGLRERLRQAVANRATKRLMHVYNRSKHGFIALHWENPLRLLMVERAYGGRRQVCWIQCTPFLATEDSVRKLAENTKTLAQTMATLIALYGRVPRRPPAGE